MRKFLPITLFLALLFSLPIAAWATHESTTEEHVWSTVVTLSGTITESDPLPHPVTVTETQTVTVVTTAPPPSTGVTEPPTTTVSPPPPPPVNDCTHTLAAGGDLSTFLSSLGAGDVGCLRAGEYSDGCAVSWSLNASSRATLKSYPGELAVVHTSIGLAGNNLTVSGIEISRIPASCGGDMSGFTAQGANNEFLYNRVIGDGLVTINAAGDVSRHGFLTNTSASNTTIHGNYVYGVGSECNLDHGVYFQRSGRITRNVFDTTVCGYGIHLYSGPSNVVVAQNTAINGRVRAGILVNCSTNCSVVNNIFAFNGLATSAGGTTAGITYRACSSGCVVDNNVSFGNRGGAVGDSLAAQATNTHTFDPLLNGYHLSPNSPAIGIGRLDFHFLPDIDGEAGDSLANIGADET